MPNTPVSRIVVTFKRYIAKQQNVTGQQKLQKKIERFMKRHNMLPSKFGLTFMNDPAFVGELRRGRSPGIGTVEKLETAMKEYGK